jgi:hypothetical protein
MYHTIAAGLSNPASNWLQQWKSGWDSTPAASGGPHDTGMIMVLLVALIGLAIYAGLKRLA